MCISRAQQYINRAVRTERVLDVLIKKDGWGNTSFVLKYAFWLICQKSHVQVISKIRDHDKLYGIPTYSGLIFSFARFVLVSKREQLPLLPSRE
jgi:hypothetical protein